MKKVCVYLHLTAAKTDSVIFTEGDFIIFYLLLISSWHFFAFICSGVPSFSIKNIGIETCKMH